MKDLPQEECPLTHKRVEEIIDKVTQTAKYTITNLSGEAIEVSEEAFHAIGELNSLRDKYRLESFSMADRLIELEEVICDEDGSLRWAVSGEIVGFEE